MFDRNLKIKLCVKCNGEFSKNGLLCNICGFPFSENALPRRIELRKDPWTKIRIIFNLGIFFISEIFLVYQFLPTFETELFGKTRKAQIIDFCERKDGSRYFLITYLDTDSKNRHSAIKAVGKEFGERSVGTSVELRYLEKYNIALREDGGLKFIGLYATFWVIILFILFPLACILVPRRCNIILTNGKLYKATVISESRIRAKLEIEATVEGEKKTQWVSFGGWKMPTKGTSIWAILYGKNKRLLVIGNGSRGLWWIWECIAE